MPGQAPERPTVAKARALVLIDNYVANLEQNRASSPSATSDITTSSATLSPTDNPATPMPGSATHPAYYQPPSPSPNQTTTATATATPDHELRRRLQQYLHQHQTTPTTSAQAPHHPTPPPMQNRTPTPATGSAMPITFAHTHGRAHLHPHERLADDIPCLHTRPLPSYAVASARGTLLADDVTDYIPSQAWASAANLPVGLGWLEQPGFVVADDNGARGGNGYDNSNSNSLVPLLRDAQTGRVVEGVLGQPLYDLPILGGAAGRISTQVEAWRVAMWLCYDGRVTLHDVSARMRVVRTAEQLKVVEDALALRVVAWCEEHAGMMFHAPVDIVTERDVRLVGELGEEKVLRNVRWDLWRRVPKRGLAEKEKEYERRREAEPVFVTQPRTTAGGGKGGLGAMWPALSKREGVCYGEKAAIALGEWQERDKERLTGVRRQKKVDMVEEMLHKWLFGTWALRERPNPWDMTTMSGDPKWALERWNVEPFSPPAVDPRLQRDTGAGLYSPYLNGTSPTVAAGVFSHPHGQPPDNTSNAGHGTPGSAGPPMQQFAAQASPHPTVSSASPHHTPQMFLQSPVQQAAQQAPQPTQTQSNAGMGLGLSNTHLPNTAQPQYQPSTPTVPTAMTSPNASATMQSPSVQPQSAAAPVGQQQPSGPFTPPLHYAQARPAPATAPPIRFVNVDQESYGRSDNQSLVQEAHARAPTPNAGDSLWPNHFRPPSAAGPGA